MAAARRLLLSALALALACAGEGGFRNPIEAAIDVDVDDERSVGAEVDAAIRAQVPLVDDPIVLGFVQGAFLVDVGHVEPAFSQAHDRAAAGRRRHRGNVEAVQDRRIDEACAEPRAFAGNVRRNRWSSSF